MSAFVRTHESGAVLSDERSRLDFARVHAWLAASYWSPGVPREVVERAAAHSLAFGLYAGGSGGAGQIGYARVVSDRATFAYVCDVVVAEGHRGRGLGTWVGRELLGHPELQGLRRWLLTTQTAHAVYERVGFVRAPFPERFMVIDRPDLYRPA